MTNEQIKKSLADQLAAPLTFEVKEQTTVIKEYNASDLPAYFKWEAGTNPWYFRVMVRDGKIVSHLLKETYEGLELTYTTITSAFDKSNTPIDEDAWRNQMHKFIKQIS